MNRMTCPYLLITGKYLGVMFDFFPLTQNGKTKSSRIIFYLTSFLCQNVSLNDLYLRYPFVRSFVRLPLGFNILFFWFDIFIIITKKKTKFEKQNAVFQLGHLTLTST